MTPTQVQRTLVKSPPELWAELSDPAALARHLGEIGEIRITRIEPEHKVEWASNDASGTVLIRPSAWGTRVTLTASRGPVLAPDLPAPPASEREPSPPEAASSEQIVPSTIAGPHASDRDARIDGPAPGGSQAKPAAAEPTPAAAPSFAEPTPSPAPSPAPQAARVSAERPEQRPPLGPSREAAKEIISWQPEPAGEPPRRLLTRMLARFRRNQPPAQQPAPAPLGTEPAHAEQKAPAPQDADSPAPVKRERISQGAGGAEQAQPGSPRCALEPPAALSPHAQTSARQPSELPHETSAPPRIEDSARAETPSAPAPAEANDELEAVLSSVLDSLGSAHHRPFSRA
jgi:hypothetical protein